MMLRGSLRFLARRRARSEGTAVACATVRAFITERRIGRARRERALAALRSFYRHLERESLAEGAALRAVRLPTLPRTLPRPLSETDAVRAIRESGRRLHETWIAARNAALVTLTGRACASRSAQPEARRCALCGFSLIVGKYKERSVPVRRARAKRWMRIPNFRPSRRRRPMRAVRFRAVAGR